MIALTLALFVLRVLADDHYAAMSLDDLALFADLLNGWLHFHCICTIPFSLCVLSNLFRSPGDPSLGGIVD